MDFKNDISELIINSIKKSNDLNIANQSIANFLETPKDKKNGDVSFPCFKLAKILKRSPIEIANIIKENIDIENTVVSKIDIVNGFLNFYIDLNHLSDSLNMRKNSGH